MKKRSLNIHQILDRTEVRIFLIIFLVVLFGAVISAVFYSIRKNQALRDAQSNYILTIEDILKDRHGEEALEKMSDKMIVQEIEDIFNSKSRLPLFSDFYLPESLDLDSVDTWQLYNVRHSRWSREDIGPWLTVPNDIDPEALRKANDDLMQDLLDHVP